MIFPLCSTSNSCTPDASTAFMLKFIFCCPLFNSLFGITSTFGEVGFITSGPCSPTSIPSPPVKYPFLPYAPPVGVKLFAPEP